MGTWDWDRVANRLVRVADAPAAARLAEEVIAHAQFDADWERMVFERSGLPQLSLTEWNICDEVESIFALLRSFGSQRGYVVEQGEKCGRKEHAREIALCETTAEQIARDLAMEFPMAFVDEQQVCLLASYFSDYALIAMREDLFATWLESRPLELTMFAFEEPYPLARDLETAREMAARRSDAWTAHVNGTPAG